MKDAGLDDLEGLMRDVFLRFCRPHGALPTGSTILIGSVSHLANVGVQQYAEDLVRMSANLARDYGGGL